MGNKQGIYDNNTICYTSVNIKEKNQGIYVEHVGTNTIPFKRQENGVNQGEITANVCPYMTRWNDSLLLLPVIMYKYIKLVFVYKYMKLVFVCTCVKLVVVYQYIKLVFV